MLTGDELLCPRPQEGAADDEADAGSHGRAAQHQQGTRQQSEEVSAGGSERSHWDREHLGEYVYLMRCDVT